MPSGTCGKTRRCRRAGGQSGRGDKRRDAGTRPGREGRGRRGGCDSEARAPVHLALYLGSTPVEKALPPLTEGSGRELLRRPQGVGCPEMGGLLQD